MSGLQSKAGEIWKPVCGYEVLYEVSNAGRVRSLHRHGTGKRKQYGGSILATSINPHNGYAYVTLCDDIGLRPRRAARVHVLVAECFLGPCQAGHEVRHADGVRHHNVVANLSYVTHQENCADKVQHGTAQRGENHPMAKLSDSQAQEIVSMYHQGETQKILSGKFGVSQSTISDILRGKRKQR